jgi:hypothetical protein
MVLSLADGQKRVVTPGQNPKRNSLWQPVEKLLRSKALFVRYLLKRRQNSAQKAHLPHVNERFFASFFLASAALAMFFDRLLNGLFEPLLKMSEH